VEKKGFAVLGHPRPEEAGRGTKEARRVPLSRFWGPNRGSAKRGSSSFGELLACETTTLCSRVFVDVTPLMEYPEGMGDSCGC